MTIDGADEISADFQGIKGGGCFAFRENSRYVLKETIWIVDSSKLVDKLGKFPLPVEVIPYGSQQLLHILKKRFQPVLRTDETEKS